MGHALERVRRDAADVARLSLDHPAGNGQCLLVSAWTLHGSRDMQWAAVARAAHREATAVIGGRGPSARHWVHVIGHTHTRGSSSISQMSFSESAATTVLDSVSKSSPAAVSTTPSTIQITGCGAQH